MPQVQFGFVERGARGDLRVVVTGFAGSFQRLSQLGFGGLLLAVRLLACACAISRRRTEIAPGSSPYNRS